MDTDTFDRLSRLFGMPGTRRAALGALLATTILGTTLGSTAAKGKRDGNGKRRGKHRGQGNRGTSAQAKEKGGNHCISPSGTDLNVALGISAQIVSPTPPFSGCDTVGSGERWTVAAQSWTVAQTFEAVPDEFVPEGDTPLADFLAKFTAVKYVIDPGTKQEKTVLIPSSGALLVVDLDEGVDLVSPITLGTLQSLPVGEHVVERSWAFSALHCDGVAANIAENCFPAGETRVISVRFEVVPGHN